MSEALQKYLPPNRNGLPLAAPAEFWRKTMAFAGDIRTLFIVLVGAPTLLASVYFGLIAAPQYVSHVEYVVRGVDAHRSSGLAQLLNTFGVSRAADETAAIESFLKSREVLERLNSQFDLRAIYGSKNADWLARFPRFWERDTLENLFSYTRSYFEVTNESVSGVTKLDVSAFDPKAAQSLAAAMLALAGDMANNLNARAQVDMVDSSKRELDEARDAVVALQAQITEFRNKELLVDPLAFAGTMLQAIGTLSLERARAQTQISETERLSPNNPSLEGLKASASALDRKVDEERSKLAGDNSALAGKVANYERLTLLRELAEKRYSSALVSLQTTQTEAQRKRVYIEEIVRPNLPDQGTKPERLRSVLNIFVIGFIAFSVIWILTVGSKDHAQ